jgi:peroxiredoxin
VSSTLTRKLEILSNVAVTIAAIAVCVTLARQYFPGEVPGSPESFQGKSVNMASITATPGNRNVVLALSQTCRFCEQEMPFYRNLSALAARAKTHVYAVFPPSEKESDKYLERHSVRTDGVTSTALDAIGVRGTPTLLLIDATGKIERAWVGALTDAQEKEVLQTVQRGL